MDSLMKISATFSFVNVNAEISECCMFNAMWTIGTNDSGVENHQRKLRSSRNQLLSYIIKLGKLLYRVCKSVCMHMSHVLLEVGINVFSLYGGVFKRYSSYYTCDCSYRLSVCSVCATLKSARPRGQTGALALNLNAGHCAACRFRFCLSPSLCAQGGNPSNMARIPIKSNNLLPPSAIEARWRWGGPTVHPADLAGESCKAPVPSIWCVTEGVVSNCLSICTGTKLTRSLG